MTKAVLEAAYCVNRPCEVRLLGGADHALSTLGYTPQNWQVLEFSDTTREFVKGLDFFIHYPHEEYIEEFGRAVLEAMGLGIPVILPPVFRNTFGDYAHYAEPEDVWPLIQRLWDDPELYNQSADKGLQFVNDKAAYHVLASRLARLVEPQNVSEAYETMKLAERRIADLELEKQELQRQLIERNRLVESYSDELASLAHELKTQRQALDKLRAAWKPLRWIVGNTGPDPYARPSGLQRLLWRIKKRIPQRPITIIAQSPLFDAEWYVQQYPELANDPIAKVSPARHYLEKGGFEGLDPSPQFRSQWYLDTNRDIKAAGVNPLLHYILYGIDEGRAPR